MQLKYPFFALLLALNLVACGFHLRGQSQLPAALQRLSVEWSDDTELNAILKTELQRSGVILSENGVTLTVTVKVRPELIVAKATSGLQVELLGVELSYSLVDAVKAKQIKQSQTIVQKKEFEYDNNNVLASRSEKAKVYKQLKKQAVRVLIYQLQRIDG